MISLLLWSVGGWGAGGGVPRIEMGVALRQMSGVFQMATVLSRYAPALEGVGYHLTRVRAEARMEGTGWKLEGAWEGGVQWSTFPLDGLTGWEGSPLYWKSMPSDRRDTVGGVVYTSRVAVLTGVLKTPWGSVALGRQPVTLGISPILGVWNVLSPVSPVQLDPEFVPGVDGVVGWVYPREDIGGMGWFHGDRAWLVQGVWEGLRVTAGVLGGVIRGYPRVGGYGEVLVEPVVFWGEGYRQFPVPGEDGQDWGMEVGLRGMGGTWDAGVAYQRYALGMRENPAAIRTMQTRGLRVFSGRAYALLMGGWRSGRSRLEGVGVWNLEDGSALLEAFFYRDLSDLQDVAFWVVVGLRSSRPVSPPGGEFGGLAWGWGVFWRWNEG